MGDRHNRWWARWRKTPPVPTPTTTPDAVAARILATVAAEAPDPGEKSEQPERKDGPPVRYPDSHYEKVAKLYLKHGSIAKVQNHFPNYSESSVRRWVAECRKRGLLPPKAKAKK
jgi:hypothetical protein